ncbi:hypothetical protein JCM16303_003107 [Sporobolomyces ruberrimus]
MPSSSIFDALDIDHDAQALEPDYHLRRDWFDKQMKQDYHNTNPNARDDVVQVLENLHPESPGWYFSQRTEWDKVGPSDRILDSILAGRRRRLNQFKIAIGSIHSEARVETARTSPWDRLIEHLNMDESRLRNDRSWYRIEAVLTFAQERLEAYWKSPFGLSQRTPEDQGLTPEGVLRKLGFEVPHSLLDKPVHASAPVLPSQLQQHGRQRVEQVLPPHSSDPSRAQPAPRSLQSASPRLDAPELAPPPTAPQDTAALTRRRKKRDLVREPLSHLKNRLFRKDSDSSGGGPPAPTNSLGRSNRLPLRYSVIYPDI